jgi:2'-5' RNA ligase
VQRASLDAVSAALAAAASGADPFDVAVSGLGAFPSAGRARVLWAGVVEGAAPAAELARRVDAALGPLGFPPEPRPFSAHVTVGRVRTPRPNRLLAAALAGGGLFGRQRVDRLALMRSEMSARGARYTELAAAGLVAGAPG